MKQKNIERKIYLENIKNMMKSEYNFSEAFQYVSNQFDMLKKADSSDTIIK